MPARPRRALALRPALLPVRALGDRCRLSEVPRVFRYTGVPDTRRVSGRRRTTCGFPPATGTGNTRKRLGERTGPRYTERAALRRHRGTARTPVGWDGHRAEPSGDDQVGRVRRRCYGRRRDREDGTMSHTVAAWAVGLGVAVYGAGAAAVATAAEPGQGRSPLAAASAEAPVPEPSSAREGGTRRATRSVERGADAGDPAALLPDLPQRQAADGQPRARRDGRRARRRESRGVGEGGGEAPRRRDAPGREAAARPGRLRGDGGLARGSPGPGGRGRPESRPQGGPPPQSPRVRERGARPARSRGRRRRASAAGRRRSRLRQHGRRASDVAGPARPLHLRGAQDRPACGRRSGRRTRRRRRTACPACASRTSA